MLHEKFTATFCPLLRYFYIYRVLTSEKFACHICCELEIPEICEKITLEPKKLQNQQNQQNGDNLPQCRNSFQG